MKFGRSGAGLLLELCLGGEGGVLGRLLARVTSFHFGLLASITLGAAILADLFLLPAAMNWLYRSEHS